MAQPDFFTDQQLVAALEDRQQTDAALRFMYREYLDGYTAFVVSHGGDAADAQDLFQDSLVALIDSIRQQRFRGESSVKTFLYSIGRHLWFNEVKKRGRSGKRELNFESQRDSNDPGLEVELMRSEERLLWQKLVGKLGNGCQHLLLLFYYENQSMKEILASTNYENEQVLRNKKYKCMKELEKMIREQPGLASQLKNRVHE